MIDNLNERGNKVERAYDLMRDRYYYDFDRCKGWKQFDTDQDAWYFGVWVNTITWEILTFAEGDETLITCFTEEGYHAELADMSKFYGKAPPAFKVIDSEGKLTYHYDSRPI